MPVQVKSPIINFYGLETPFRCGVFGSSRTGKTTIIYDLLRKDLFDRKFETIYYCFPNIYENDLDWHKHLDANIEYLDHLPNSELISNLEPHSLLILDDCWYACTQEPIIRDLFKVVSGKKNLSIFVTSQNPYEGGTHARTIRNNMNYFLLFRHLGDQQINRRLTQQLGLLPQYDAAAKIGKKFSHSCIFVNVDVALEHEELRVSTNILGQPIIIV